MNFPKLNCPWIIAFISITIATRGSLSIVPTIVDQAPPFWQFVLREFVFKTISAPPSRNDILYKKLLDAPFYGGPSSEAFNDDNTLISRGNVYHMPDGQWILCQEGCVNCDSCENQKNPTVKWILRRVKRMTTSRSSLPKWDLRLTVFPQLDESSRIREHPWYNDVYLSRDELGRKNSLYDSSPETTDQAFAVDQHSQMSQIEHSDWTNEEYGKVPTNEGSNIRVAMNPNDFSFSRRRSTSPGREHSLHDSSPATTDQAVAADQHSQLSGVEQSDWTNGEYGNVPINEESNIRGSTNPDDLPVLRGRSMNSGRIKRFRVKPTGRLDPLTFTYPQDDLSGSNPMDRLREDSTPRLIMGIDQHGEKHLVHVVPVDSPADDLDSTNYRSFYQPGNSARIGRRTQQERDALSYQKLMERIMDSLNSHRNFIEKFLFSDRLEPENLNEAAIPSYSSYTERVNDDDKFERKNFDDYRVEASPRVNQYSTDSEQDDQLKRYADVTRDVKKPSGEYRNHMMKYEPYFISEDGRQDERSLASTDIERRRRNSFPKLVDSTDELQGLGENHTEIDTPDTKFSTKRQLVANSTNQGLLDPRLKINETDASINNLSEESATAKVLTVH